MSAPERIIIMHKANPLNTGFQAQGAWDKSKSFEAVYVRSDIADRSPATHNHEFAEIKNLWENIPESLTNMPYAKSPDTLRKHGLIATGHCDVDTIAFDSHSAAKKQAPVIAAMARRAAGYAIIVARGNLVVCSTPHSQSMKKMGAKAFQQSKSDVLDWVKRELGIET